MRLLPFLLLTLIYGTLYAQRSTSVPSIGTITFSQERIVTDSEALDSSLNKNIRLIASLMKDLAFQNSRKGQQSIDSAKILERIDIQLRPILEQTLDPRKNFSPPRSYQYILKDSIIESTIQDSPLQKDDERTVIQRETGKKTYYRLKDSIWVLDELTLRIPHKPTPNVQLTEFRNIKRKIQGFECFKVTVTVPQNVMEGLNLFGMEIPSNKTEDYKALSSLTTTYEMYVTDEINCKYHPVIDFTEVLHKYYPLEIVTSETLLEGVENRVTVTELVLN